MLACVITAQGQVYLRGEVKSDKNILLNGADIYTKNSGAKYKSGVAGSFGIMLRTLPDTLVVSLEGYDTTTFVAIANTYSSIILKRAANLKSDKQPKLNTIIKNQENTFNTNFQLSGETYFRLVENDFVNTKEFSHTSFAVNVNKASYSNLRRFLTNNMQVPPDAVRIEEMLNYFNLGYKEPKDNNIFSLEARVSDCPWKPGDKLIYLMAAAKKLNLDTLPKANFVFLIDVSGSMDLPNRLPLLKAAFKSFVNNLRDDDMVSIVIYGGVVAVWLPPTRGIKKEEINQSIEALVAAGDTPGQTAIQQAYKMAMQNFIPDGNNRIILATDGDFNVGVKDENELDELVSKYRNTGIKLSCLGVGMGNFKDSRLHILAERGNGSYAYLDDAMEAEKVLVKELTNNLYAVATNTSFTVNFNPDLVENFRLIGYDNRRDAIFTNANELEGGEIGSGNSSIGIFQFTPKQGFDTATSSMASVTLNYSLPGDKSVCDYSLNVYPSNLPFTELDPDLQFGTALTMFGLKLRKSEYAKDITWQNIYSIALPLVQTDDYLKTQFLQLVTKAEEVYSKIKKPRKRN